MPTVRQTTARMEKAGLRMSMRKPKRRSWRKVSRKLRLAGSSLWERMWRDPPVFSRRLKDLGFDAGRITM
jgi:hypothetical protein